LSFYKTIVQAILRNLTPDQQKKGFLIIVLMGFNAILDFFSIASFLPLMALVIDPSSARSNPTINDLYSFFEFTSHATFITTITIGVLLFVVVKNVISLWIARVKASYAFNIRSDISSRTISAYLSSSFSEFTHKDFTKELHKITSHPLAFANNIILSLTTILSETLVGIFIITCIAYYDYQVLLLVALVLVPVFVVLHTRKRRLNKISKELKTTYPQLLKYSNQAIEGFVEINAYQKHVFFIDRFEKVSKKLTDTFIKDQVLQAGTLRLTELIVAFVMCSLILYSVAIGLQYQQTLILLGVYAGASFRLVPSINRIIHAFQQLRTNEHVLHELKITPNSLEPQASIPADVEFLKSIQLNNISFQYPAGPPALREVSLTIMKGEKLAITGASGEGKTTLLLVLLGFIDQAEGELLVDGKKINNKLAWRRLIGYVPQNPYMLDGTVAENIAFGIPSEKIDRAKVLRLINKLALNDLVKYMPDGIDSRIGEHGAKLSGGQRQRIALARALYNEAEILLLDEVTNQVHSTMETEIMNLLNDLKEEKKTILIVTHRIIHPEFFDKILKLEGGKLLQETVLQA
jgi:ATP-binding cassette, subfamily B, bacterial PglK